MHRRELDGTLSIRDDGRTIDGRIVPFGEVATITERDAAGEVVTYRERFLPGCTTYVRQQAAAQGRGGPTWVALKLEHDAGFGARIGFVKTLEERGDGVHATFKLYDSVDLVKVRSMLSESHTGLSVEFADRVEPVVENGVTCRVQVYLGAVAATPVPCYAGAGITAMRAGDGFSTGTPNLDAVTAWLAEQTAGRGA
jgi:hypothetical protein